MRTTPDTSSDPLGSLGAPIREHKPAPAPAPVSPGVVRNPDGSFETKLPINGPRYAPPPQAPAAPAADEQTGDVFPVYDGAPIIFLGSDYIEAMRLLDGEESL